MDATFTQRFGGYLYSPSQDFPINPDQLLPIRQRMEMCCTDTFSPPMSGFLSRIPLSSNSKMLDLGCGPRGSYSEPFLKKGWYVIAIDQESVLVKSERTKKAWDSAAPYMEQGLLTFIKGDIITYPFTPSEDSHKFEVVACVDVLFYVPFDKIESVLTKVFNSLVPGGTFIGTMACNTDQSDPERVESLAMLSNWMLNGKAPVTDILKHFGFQVETCEPRPIAGEGNTIVEFIAKKPVSS